MSSFRDNIRKVEPYVPGEQPKAEKIIKLNTNENPYPPSPLVEKALRETEYTLRKYPDPNCAVLTRALAEYYGVEEGQIFAGVGSDDVLATAFLTYFSSDKPVLFPDITYSFYDVWAKLYEIPFHRVPLDENMEICIEDYICDNGGIVFPNPNAPTGIALPLEKIEKVLKENPASVVIVDEAYVDFGTQSALSLLDKYENLLVVQTFSKSRSLAGIRIGFAIGSKELISYMWAVRNSINSYTMNPVTMAVGAASLKDDAYFKETSRKIMETRERSKKRFKELGFEFGDSMANFIFVKHKTVHAEEIFAALREENIFVRHFSAERINNYLRVTIGTDEEMDRLFEFLEKYLSK